MALPHVYTCLCVYLCACTRGSRHVRVCVHVTMCVLCIWQCLSVSYASACMVGCVGVVVVMGVCRCHVYVSVSWCDFLVDCQNGVHLVEIVSVGLLITFVHVFVGVWCMHA